MTQTFGTNQNNDLYLGPDGNLVLLAGVEAVAAACKTACKTQFAECVLQQGFGLPNFQLIWVGTPDYGQWQTYLEQTLLNVNGVTQVGNIQLSAADNTLSFIAEINTIYGPTIVSG